MDEMVMRHYIKLPFSEVTKEMVDACLESSISSLRVSKEGNTFLKYEGAKPDCLSKYDNVDITKELQKVEWQNEEEI